MGRTVLLAVIGLLALSGTLADDKIVNSSVTQDQEVADHESSVKQDQDVTDHEFAESAPRSRLYKKSVEPRVYASSTPHTSYSYKVFAAPQTANPNGVPVKASSVIVPKALQFDLRDSYGKYVESPQTAAYKPSYPQQFVRLQDLPPHLAQPLVSAASPSFQFRAIPNYFFGPQSYQVPGLQLSEYPSGNQMGRFSEPLVYAEDIRNLAPQTIVHLPRVLQQTSNSLQETKSSPKYQRIKDKPKKSVYKSSKKNIRYRPQDVKYHSSHELAQQLQEAAPTKVSTIVNGKKTLVKIDTKPVLPLLDLNLLEPLKFDNPLVPQIQHFLPKISLATYHKLPSYNPKKDQNDYTITKVKSYETVPKKKHNTPPKSGITVKGYPNSGDYSYEINTPNHQETYNEKVLKYNKETNKQPVEFSYNEQSHKEPEIYAYVHSSKEPLKVTHVEYNNDNNDYTLKSQEQEDDKDDSSRPSSQESSADSGEYSDESEEEGAAEQSQSEESPKNQQTHYHSERFETPNYSQNNEQKGHQDAPKQQQTITYLLPTQGYQAKGGQQIQTQNYSPQPQYYIQSQASPPPKLQNNNQNVPNPYQNLNYEINQGRSQTPNQQGSLHGMPTPSHQLKVEHRGQQQQYQQKPNYGIKQEVIQTTPQYFAQPIIVQNAFQPINPEDIRVLPTHIPHSAAIKVDPSQHIQPRPQPFIIKASPSPQKLAPQQFNNPTFKPPRNNPGPNVYGQAKRVFIKQNEETPDKKHKHTEQVMAEMIDQMENSEEDFEKAYKEAAFGFPAYKQIEEDVEKDIYNPEPYGVRPTEFSIDDPIFNEYQMQGDKFPKSARLTYKTIKDNNQEDYYSDYGIHKPESFADRVNNRVEYYKMFEQRRPHKNKGQSEKLIFSPSLHHFETSPSPRPKAKQNKSPESAQHKLAPTVKYEYEYEYEPPKDSSAFASRPYHKYRTQFVEPQFQYGFEPLVSAPIAAESEMAAVASNRSPESEKPGTRKKLYKEKWYIKKTTTRNKPS